MKITIPLVLLPMAALAATPQSDWPCIQPLVPNVTAAMVWQGPPLPAAPDWQSDPGVAALVAAISPQEVDPDEGDKRLSQFLAGHGRDRARLVARIMTGLIAENDRVRDRVIAHLRLLGERQSGLADIVARLNDERDKAGATADQELIDRLAFTERTYYETQRTMRYACETPGRLDQRLGLYARTLAAALR